MKKIFFKRGEKVWLVLLVTWIIAFVAIAVGLGACNGNKIVETDYFRIELNKKEKYAIVLELTELGKEQEILAVPHCLQQNSQARNSYLRQIRKLG